MRPIDGDALVKYCNGNPFITDSVKTYIRLSVATMPTIEERKTGKWINCNGSEHWKCDQCGCRAGYWFNEENSSSYELDMSEWLSDFCPNCGARMVGEGEEE